MGYKNTEEFDMLLKEAVIREFKSEISSTSLEDFFPSREFEDKMKLLFKKNRREAFLKRFSFLIKRAAMYILIIMGILTTLFVFNEDVRARVEIIIEWFEDHTKFEFHPDGVDMERKEFDLNIIPKEYKIKEIDDLGSLQVVFLLDSSGNKIMLTYNTTDSSESIAIDNEHGNFGTTYIDGYEIITLEGHSIEDMSFVMWEMDGYRISIDGEVPIDNLLGLAKIIINNF